MEPFCIEEEVFELVTKFNFLQAILRDGLGIFIYGLSVYVHFPDVLKIFIT